MRTARWTSIIDTGPMGTIQLGVTEVRWYLGFVGGSPKFNIAPDQLNDTTDDLIDGWVGTGFTPFGLRRLDVELFKS